MENMVNVPKHGSLWLFPEEDNVSSSRFPAATPNVHARSDLINRSTNNVLGRLPTCIDSNITSSVDYKENIPPHDRQSKPPADELLKTPELKLPKCIVRELPRRRLRQTVSANSLKEKNQLNLQHHLSPPIKASNNAFSPKKRVLLADTERTPNVEKPSLRTERSLMAQPEFKIPLPIKDTRKIFTIYCDTIVVNKKRSSIVTQLGSQEPCMVKKSNNEKENLSSHQIEKKHPAALFKQSNDEKENIPSHHIQKKHPAALGKKSKLQLPNSTLCTFPSGKSTPVAQPKFKVPKSIVVNRKPYKILFQIESGGSSIVYCALDSKRKVVAVKCVMLKGFNHQMREVFKKEIEFLKKFQDSNHVIMLFDFEHREDKLLLVLEYGGKNFANYILNQNRPLGTSLIKRFWHDMLKAVADIHKFRIVHFDLKPDNFVLAPGGLKLIDFGIAIAIPEGKTSVFRDIEMGTLHYMSPEAITQISDGKKIWFNISVKSDIWSLGCILYSLVYGVTPFQNYITPVEKIYAFTKVGCIFGKTPYGSPDRLLVDVLKKCLKHDPKERASVEELLKHPYLELSSLFKKRTSHHRE